MSSKLDLKPGYWLVRARVSPVSQEEITREKARIVKKKKGGQGSEWRSKSIESFRETEKHVHYLLSVIEFTRTWHRGQVL